MNVLLANAILSAVMNLVLLAGVPFLVYFVYQKRRRKLGFREVTQRAGLRLGKLRYITYSLVLSLVSVMMILVWPPPLESIANEGSAQRQFVGLGLTAPSIAMALIYGVVKTGFTEEFLFRGLIGGSLARRLPIIWANVVQAAIFLAPHLLLLAIMPQLSWFLPLIFVGALVVGWLRIKSGSIVGPWLIHASLNAATGLSVAVRSTL